MKSKTIRITLTTLILCSLISVKAQLSNKDSLENHFNMAELAVNKLFGFNCNMIGLSKEKVIELNSSSVNTTPSKGFDLTYILKDGVSDAHYKFDDKNKCVKVMYAKADDKQYETVKLIRQLLEMKLNTNGSGYECNTSIYFGEVFWSKRQNGQLIVYNFAKSSPIEKEFDKNGIQGTWSGSYSKIGTTLLNGESFVFTKMKNKENEYWCRYLSTNGPERKFGAHYEKDEIRVYGTEDRTFILLTFDKELNRIIAPSKGGKDVYFMKLSE